MHRRRLAALKEFSDLGAGFKIAALDLELRGAGNLLGGQQSGHIEAVGFELYTRMLDRAVREMKGEAAPDEAETQLNLGLQYSHPGGILFRKRTSACECISGWLGAESESRLNDVRAELEDRYGEPPASVRNLLEYAALKLLAMRVGATAIERKRDLVTIKFRQNAEIDLGRLAKFVSSQRGAQFTPDGTLKYLSKAVSPGEVLAHCADSSKSSRQPAQALPSVPS